MTYIANSFMSARNALDRITTEAVEAVNLRDRSVAQIQRQITVLNNLAQAAPVGWLETVQYINSEAAANPTDENWQRLKAEKDRIVADYQAEVTKTQAIIDAINAV